MRIMSRDEGIGKYENISYLSGYRVLFSTIEITAQAPANINFGDEVTRNLH